MVIVLAAFRLDTMTIAVKAMLSTTMQPIPP
jgi:hypothetical protein